RFARYWSSDVCSSDVGVVVVGLQPVERGGRIRQLPFAPIERALRAADAAKVEAQHREPLAHKGMKQGVDHLVVHGAAVLGVRVQDRKSTCLNSSHVKI